MSRLMAVGIGLAVAAAMGLAASAERETGTRADAGWFVADAGPIFIPKGYIFAPPADAKEYPLSYQHAGVEMWHATPARVITITEAGRKAGWRCEEK